MEEEVMEEDIVEDLVLSLDEEDEFMNDLFFFGDEVKIEGIRNKWYKQKFFKEILSKNVRKKGKKRKRG